MQKTPKWRAKPQLSNLATSRTACPRARDILHFSGVSPRVFFLLQPEFNPEKVPIKKKLGSLPNNLYQHSLSPSPIKLPKEYLLPGAEIQLAVGDGHHHFPTY
jgi:hypothetical protein